MQKTDLHLKLELIHPPLFFCFLFFVPNYKKNNLHRFGNQGAHRCAVLGLYLDYTWTSTVPTHYQMTCYQDAVVATVSPECHFFCSNKIYEKICVISERLNLRYLEPTIEAMR